jgi:hypothetical protein
VGAIAVAAMPGGSLNLAPPQATVEREKAKIENTRIGCSGAHCFTFDCPVCELECLFGNLERHAHQGRRRNYSAESYLKLKMENNNFIFRPNPYVDNYLSSEARDVHEAAENPWWTMIFWGRGNGKASMGYDEKGRYSKSPYCLL